MENTNDTNLRTGALKSPGSRPARDQSGFALVLLVTLLPLLLGGILFLYFATTQIEIRSHLNQVCRAELLEIQEEGSSLIKSLMALNKLIDVVKWADFIAGIATVLAFFNPGLIAVVRGILRLTKSARTAIPKIQKLILFGLGPGLTQKLLKVRATLLETLNEYTSKTENLLLISDKVFIGNYVRPLSVEPKNPKARLTKYKLREDFSKKQNIFLLWQYQLTSNSEIFPWTPWKQKFHGYCSATLREEEPWEPVLYVDKLIWNLF